MSESKHKENLKKWQKAVKTLKSGEPVEVDDTVLYPELQDGQIELDLKSAEKMVEICKRRIANAKLKSKGVVDIELEEVDCGCDVEGKAYILAQDHGISDKTLVAISQQIVEPRAKLKGLNVIVTVRDINLYIRKGLPQVEKVEEPAKPAKLDEESAELDTKSELDELRAKCKELGLNARGGKAKLETRIAEALEAKPSDKSTEVNPLA